MAQSNAEFDNPDAGPSSTPASDPDPYSMSHARAVLTSVSSTSLPPHINPSTLPQGLPLLGPLTGFSSSRRIRTINARLVSISSMIHRPLTVPEEQAIAWHTSKGLGVSSWGPTLGIAAGLGRWWQTMGNMRWLWVGKLNDESVNQAWKEYYEAQAGAAEEGATEGAAKRPPNSIRWDGGRLWAGDRELMKAWNPVRREAVMQGFRAMPYVGLGWFVAAMVMSGYAATVTAVGEMKDQRLGNLERELREQVQRTMKRRQGDVPGVAGGVGRERRDPTGQGTRTPSELWKKHQEEIQRVNGVVGGEDDASPTSGDGFFGETEAEERARMMGESDAKPQGQGGFRRAPQDPFQTTDRQGGFQQDRYERQTRKSDDSFDDASPTGGASATGNDDGGAGGSVWERIRQNSASSSPSEPSSAGGRRTQRGGGSQRPRPQAQQQKKEGDSFAFSSSEEERNYAKDEAQKDFDARVEKEREGGDFGGGNDGKW